MAARTPVQAVQAFLDGLDHVRSCVTKAVFDIGGGYHPADRPHDLTLGQDGPVRLGGESRLALSVKMQYRIVEGSAGPRRWAVNVVAYQHAILDRDGREIVAYHWHPGGRVTFPHLHLGAGAAEGPLRPDLAGTHLPTGHVTLQDVLRMAVVELGVRPLRPDWDEVLHRSQ